MFEKLVYESQHVLNKYVLRKHEKILAIEENIDWDKAGNEVWDKVNLTKHLPLRNLNAIMFCLAIIAEVCELMAALGYKWWSTKNHNWVNVREDVVKNIREEYVDILHFIISLGQTLGLNVSEILDEYKEKNKENYARQERGY